MIAVYMTAYGLIDVEFDDTRPPAGGFIHGHQCYLIAVEEEEARR